MKRIALIILSVATIIAGSVSCQKDNITPESSMPSVSMSIIPDFSDGSVYSYSDDGSFFLRVGVTPEEYLDKFGNDGKYIYRADFRKVITKVSPEDPDFTVVGEITSASVEEGYMTASFTLSEDEMEKLWDADYVVSFAIKTKDGSDGFMTAFVPVSWYSREGSGGLQEVHVGDYIVTVRVAEDVVANDILMNVHVDGETVIIKAISEQKESLSCNVGETAHCQKTRNDGIYTFTISDITMDIEAVLSYAPKVTISVSSDNNGEVWIGEDKTMKSGQFRVDQTVTIHAEPSKNHRLYKWNDNGRGTSRMITVGETDAEYSARFIPADFIPGMFSVSNDRQVFFSKGNLFYDGNKYCFEENQYDVIVNEKDGDRFEPAGHVGHFYWSTNAEIARSLSKWSDSQALEQDVFFTNDSSDDTKANANFEVNGQKGIWRVLSGGNNGEWKYLINKDNECGQTVRSDKYKCGVKVCGHDDCLILLPDEWKWGENGVGTDWQNEYSESTTVKWSTMDAAGAVCLPAAGVRLGDPSGARDPAQLYDDICRYWSSSTYDEMTAFDVNTFSGNVYSAGRYPRYRAHSVRLVTEYPSGTSAE